MSADARIDSEITVDSPENVTVSFPGPRAIGLATLGIDAIQAADLRHRMSAIADDWDNPEMDVYDTDQSL